MEKLDWVAIYGAALATAIAIANFLQWLLSGPRLSVIVFSPSQTDYNSAKTFLAIISNTGKSPTVVQSIEVSFRTSRWIWGKEIGRAVFDEKSRWKPSVKLVPVPNKTNTLTPEPNVLQKNEELRAPASAVSNYDEAKHWIRVIASARNSSRKFSGWARPHNQNVEIGAST
ncbi:MAG TPA: hypothetical protein VL202_15540 [Pararhizobium sp.]|uniref:hypothetical protein n=1 Tax=Pararhizobium sp. TaxID=1977563 RepID=UPI002D1A84E8|nr:hypothetical protein [Pararhizobium sp.]HTO32570.1 hypothetical protein [Pararhizobium sp.]